MIEYRLLEGAEKEKLADAFPCYAGKDLKDIPIAGAILDGKVVGLGVINLVPHFEPVWIEEKSHVDFRRLVKVAESVVIADEMWLFAPNEKAVRMAEICGAKEMGWKVMRKELK